MVVTLTHRSGRMTTCLGDADLDNLVAELDGPDDAEHPDVSVSHGSGWALSAFPSGLLVWEDVDGAGPGVHRESVDRVEVRRLFGLLASDEVEAITALDWKPGHGTQSP